MNNEVSITAPNGQTFSWNEELLEEIQRYSDRNISMKNYRAPHPSNPRLMSVDQASVHIITNVSIRNLEKLLGKKVDQRRFRANLLVSVDEHTHSESDWIGKHFMVGDAVLQVHSFCERCAMITMDPTSLDRDPALLKTVYEEMNLCFGVYASVEKPGTIQVGQKVYVS